MDRLSSVRTPKERSGFNYINI